MKTMFMDLSTLKYCRYIEEMVLPILLIIYIRTGYDLATEIC